MATLLSLLRFLRRVFGLDEPNADHATFHLVDGDPNMPVTLLNLAPGETKYVEVTPRRPDGTPDTTIENPHWSKSGDSISIAPYGDGLGANALRQAVTGLPIAGDSADALVRFECDSDAGSGTTDVLADLDVKVTNPNATTGDFEEIAAP